MNWAERGAERVASAYAACRPLGEAATPGELSEFVAAHYRYNHEVWWHVQDGIAALEGHDGSVASKEECARQVVALRKLQRSTRGVLNGLVGYFEESGRAG